MEQKILSKLEELTKYIPFVDYLLSLLSVDQEEHKKFIKIKKWILTKERYSLDTLAKIEKSFISQYNNLFLLNDIKVPKEIMAIFNNVSASVKCVTVNLCSDDEESDIKPVQSVASSTKNNNIIAVKVNDDDDDDEVCIVDETANDRASLPNDEESTSSTEMWQRIDRICDTVQENKDTDHEDFDIPRIDDLNASMEEEKLFTRRESCEKKKHKKKKHKKNKKHEKEAKKNDNKKKRERSTDAAPLTVTAAIETISLDSSSEEEVTAAEIKEKEKKTDKETLSTEQQEPVAQGSENNSNAMLENMDIDELSKVFQNLSKRSGIDLEVYLQELLTKVKPTSHKEIASVNINVNEMQTNGLRSQEHNGDADNFNCAKTNPIQFSKDLNKGHTAKAVHNRNSSYDLNENHFNNHYDCMQQINPLNYTYMPSIEQNIMAPTVEPQIPIQNRANMPNYCYKVNYNDPRIMRQLRMIQSSKEYSEIARERAANLTNFIPQMANEPIQTLNASPTPYTPTTYGEYKRQKEERLQAEQQRKLAIEQEAALEKFKAAEAARKIEEAKCLAAQVAEQQRKAAEAEREKQAALIAKECEQREHNKHTEQIREILSMHTKELDVLLKQNADKLSSPTRDHPHQASNKTTTPPEQPTVSSNCQTTAKRSKEEDASKQLDRIFKTLECTVKGFNYVSQAIGGRRRASISARCAIAEQANCRSEEESSQELLNVETQAKTLYKNTNSSLLDNNCYVPQVIEGKRRGSISARCVIAEQVNCRSEEENGQELLKVETQARSLYKNAKNSLLDNRSISSSTTSLASTDIAYEDAVICDRKLQMQPVVMLTRLTDKEIEQELRPTTVKPKLESKRRPSFKVLLVEDTNRRPEVESPVEQIATQRPIIKRTNIDALMTERNTRFCVLCKSKPSDITNHYIYKHKTESYVSRMTREELDTLLINPAFATLVSSNSRNIKYKINCAFCDEELKDTFNNLHRHYSTHTGEYAYQCSICKLQKPYRADIESHQCHSKSCRNGRTLTLYQYPSNLMVIYLHCCNQCNFVQLNEANVFKHQRDHHNAHYDDPKAVTKYILAAIKDDKETPPASPTPVPVPTLTTTLTKAAAKPTKPTNSSAVMSVADIEQEMPSKCNVKNEFSSKIVTVANGIAADEGVRVSNEPINDHEVEELMSSLFGDNANQDIQEFISESIPTTTAAVVTNQSRNSNNETFLPIPCSSLGDKTPTTAIINDSDMNDLIPTPERLSAMQRLANSSIVHMPMFLPDEDIKPDIQQLTAQILAQQQENIKIANANLATENNVPSRATVVVAQTTTTQPLQIAQNSPHQNYRSYASGSACFGLLKCMVSDCIYSTDIDAEMLQHLEDHSSSECPPQGFLNCAYCQLNADSKPSTPKELIAHIRKRHSRSRYQCSHCSYRSCVPGNVFVHCRQSHYNAVNPNATDIIVYECEGPNATITERLPQMMRAKSQNVKQLICSHCTEGFFVFDRLQLHYKQVHNITINESSRQTFPRYACIYCAHNELNEKGIVEHLAKGHPDEYAFVSERVLQSGLKIDTLQNLVFRNVEEIVPHTQIKTAKSVLANMFVANNNDDDAADDISEFEKKPSMEKLIEVNIEVLKPLLVKLTTNTGISPSVLYHCPENNCGGFFSIYELWRRHMTQRHQTLLTTCPHCPIELPLTEFRQHFTQHCQHLYLCFHCTETFVDERELVEHAAKSHMDLQKLRLETIQFNINYCFKVLINATLHVERLKFLLELQTLLQQRIKLLEDLEGKSMLTEWRVPVNVQWLEYCPERSKSCFSCSYRVSSDDQMFNHILTNHSVNGLVFSCQKCDFKDKFNSWEPIFKHIKTHETHTYVCCVCLHHEFDRRKISKHVRKAHDSRDVPLLSVKRRDGNIYAELFIIFATHKRTFAIDQQCLCCSKRVDAMVMHLKQEHGINLRYFCELCNKHLPKLQECHEHFRNKHDGAAIKLNCMLACQENLSITSLEPLNICTGDAYTEQINRKRSRCHITDNNVIPNKIPKITVKQEPTDDIDDSECLIFMEEDDIVVEEELKACRNEKEQQQQQNTNNLDVPRIKCVSIQNLIQSSNGSQAEDNANVMPTTSPARERQALLLEGYQGTIHNSNTNCSSSDVRVKPVTITLLTKSAEGSRNATASTLSVRITSPSSQSQQQPLQKASVLQPVVPQQSQQQQGACTQPALPQQQTRVLQQMAPQQAQLPRKVVPQHTQQFDTYSTLRQRLQQPPLTPQATQGIPISVVQNRNIQIRSVTSTVPVVQQSPATHQFPQASNYATTESMQNVYNTVTITPIGSSQLRAPPPSSYQQHLPQQQTGRPFPTLNNSRHFLSNK